MFLLYHSEGCNICEMVLHECYVNDLHSTTCSGMLGHHNIDNIDFEFLAHEAKEDFVNQDRPRSTPSSSNC
jgi:hypothetical protein